MGGARFSIQSLTRFVGSVGLASIAPGERGPGLSSQQVVTAVRFSDQAGWILGNLTSFRAGCQRAATSDGFARWEGQLSTILIRTLLVTFLTLFTLTPPNPFRAPKGLQSLDKAPRLSIRRVIWILATDTVFVKLNQYSQILRRQCSLL